MNRRIRKKKIDAADRLLANGLRLYANRPRPEQAPEQWEELARAFLSLSLGLALRERIQTVPGPLRGYEMDPPRDVSVQMPDAETIHVTGLVLIRDRHGEAEVAVQEFRLSADKQRGAWRMTRVLMVDAPRELWEAAI